jgi:hypothetical protein
MLRPTLVAVLLAMTALARLEGANPAPPRPTDESEGWVRVTSFGAVGDGTTDDTAAFIKAAATQKNLRVPKPRAHYKLTGKVRVYGSVVGEGMPEIRMYGADGKDSHVMFEVNEYRGSGLVLRGLHLNGQWDGFGTAGEWSHLVLIKGSKNVTIENNVLERPYGDCILVGGEGHPHPSANVVIRNNRMDGARRCNVALISARNVSIQRNVIRKTNGYVSAIDLEPNPNRLDAVNGVSISDNEFDVAGVAIMLYTRTSNLPSGGVEVSGNTVKASRFFLKPDHTGPWSQIALSNNTYLGGGSTGMRSFVAIAHADAVTIEGNRISLSGAGGIGGGDDLRAIRSLRLANNVWSVHRSYPVTVTSCPGAQISGNQSSGIAIHVRP